MGGTTHWRIDAWEDGTTEGGSSGSPLFNDDKQVIGQLHGGVASCFNNINDYYGRLALSFDYIKEWLDPDSSGVTSINGYPNPVILAVDPGLRSIQDIEATYCDVNTISPTIVLKNYGSTEVTAIDIDYYLNGNLEGSINWTGSLMNGETADVVVDDITIPSTGNHIFSAEFDYLNDENLNNNERSFSFFATLGGIEIDLSILTDDWGSETSWAIFTLDGDEIASGSGYGPNFSPTLFEEQICVPDTCIEFVIYDSADDGICCDYGEGAYSVSYNGVEMVSGGEFSSEESTEICPNLIDNIAEVNPLEAISIYPNPANDKLFIKLNNFPAQDLNMRLFNLMGQQLYNIDGQVDGSILSIEVATWPRGVYLLDISSEGWTRSIKVILD